MSSHIVNAICVDVDDLHWSLVEAGITQNDGLYYADVEIESVLEWFSKKQIRATFFIPGIFILKSPKLVQRIAEEGHEVASHGSYHSSVCKYNADQFSSCIEKNKKQLEDLVGKEVVMYKAPMWSLSEKTPWAYERLIRGGFKVDHSAMPRYKSFLGIDPGGIKPFLYCNELLVIPPTVFSMFGINVPICGGFYNAYVPHRVQAKYFQYLNKKGLTFNLFFHPFELSPAEMNKKFVKSSGIYGSLYGAHAGRYESILSNLAKVFTFSTLSEAYKKYM